MNAERPGWILDRRVPVAIIFALFVQAGGALWWAAKMDSRVIILEAKLEQQIAQNRSLVDSLVKQDKRTAVLETQFLHISQSLKDIKNLIEKRYRDP